jgi:hypothetical protein
MASVLLTVEWQAPRRQAAKSLAVQGLCLLSRKSVTCELLLNRGICSLKACAEISLLYLRHTGLLR